MIKEIKYGRSKHLKLVIPVYIRTIKKRLCLVRARFGIF